MRSEESRTRKQEVFGHDATAYARSCGYRGEKPVIVLDGRVITHRNIDWTRFMAKVRYGRL